jgi:hypothetical protein
MLERVAIIADWVSLIGYVVIFGFLLIVGPLLVRYERRTGRYLKLGDSNPFRRWGRAAGSQIVGSNLGRTLCTS